jgi:hypothetical protein
MFRWHKRPQIIVNDHAINRQPLALHWDSVAEIIIPTFSLHRNVVQKLPCCEIHNHIKECDLVVLWWSPGCVVIYTHCKWQHITDNYYCFPERSNDFVYVKFACNKAFSLCFLLLT